MINQKLTLTKSIAFIEEVSFNKINHIYKTMIKSSITYESIIWHELKDTKLISRKTVNSLAIIQNNCLKRIFDVYKITLIAKVKTETHILLINIYLNKLQTKIKQRLQNFEHYKRIKKIKKRLHRMLKKKKRT